jgi:hypothetical protein
MTNERKAFFGPEGLTMTSANHVANIAKEYYESFEAKLRATSFVEESIQIIGSVEPTLAKKGTPDIIENATMYINEIADAKSLIAFLREAIKEKDRLLQNARQYVSEEYVNCTRPERRPYLTKEQIIASWNTGEQERYLYLETLASVIGNYIHPDKPLSVARTKLHRAMQESISAELKGRDTIVRTLSACRTEEEVEKLFFTLQKWHRNIEAELNGIKHKIDVAIREDETRVDNEWEKECMEWSAKQQKLWGEIVSHRKKEQERIENLKIVIPNRLRPVYDRIMAK